MNISKKNIALLDTNILIYAADETSSFHKASKNLRDRALSGKINLCVCPQVLTEFFAVITNFRRVENPRDVKESIAEIEKYLESENLLKIYPKEDTLSKTLELAGKYNLKAHKIFDAQLAATMLSNGIIHIYTYNEDDFSKFEGIKVLTP